MFNAITIRNKKIILFLVSTFLFLAVSLYASDSPIYIEADEMSSTEKNSAVLFSGNVDAKQGDLQIRSDKMTVYYTEKGKETSSEPTDAKQQIEKLICTGNVEITRSDWLGTAEKMTYLAKKEQVILNGNAKAWQGQNVVTGEKIIYYMKEGRSEVVGGTSVTVGSKDKKEEKKSRVKMTILQ